MCIRDSCNISSPVMVSNSHSRAFDFFVTHQSEKGSRGSWTCFRKLYLRTNKGDSLRKMFFNLSRHPPFARIGVSSLTPSSVFKALLNFRSNTLLSSCLEITIDLSKVFLLWSKYALNLSLHALNSSSENAVSYTHLTLPTKRIV